MRTPPLPTSIRTSVPSKTRCTQPSCQRLARSAPNARNRSVESPKSNGSGSETANDVVEVLEALVGNPLVVEILGQPARGEDEVRDLGRAPVGVAVADVDEVAVPGELLHDRALAGLPAGVAALVVAPLHAPAVGARVDAVRMQLDLDAFALEDRLDQLVEAARDDDDAPALLSREGDEVAEAVAHAHVVELPLHDLVERRRDRLELARDHIAERQVSFVQPAVDLRVHLGIAEVARDRVQQVHLRDGAVEVDSNGPTQKWLVTP